MKVYYGHTYVLLSCITVITLLVYLFFPPWGLKKELISPHRDVHISQIKTSLNTETKETHKKVQAVDTELLQHLHEYNPTLPTDYGFHPDPSRVVQESYFRNTKHLMGRYIFDRLKNKNGGFFVECGAYDGLWISNTAWLEKEHNWKGLLVEVDPNQSSILKKRNRRATVADVCLSTEVYPVVLNFTLLRNGRTFLPNKIRKPEHGTPLMVKCYPLHMILDALGVSEVDYFSLDVEGVDLAVLKTIPWHRIKIKLISVEILKPEADSEIRRYLEAVGYRKIVHIASATEFQMDDVYELIE